MSKFGTKIGNLDELESGNIYLVKPRNLRKCNYMLNYMVGLFNNKDANEGLISFNTMYVKSRFSSSKQVKWVKKSIDDEPDKYLIHDFDNCYDIYSLSGAKTNIMDNYVEKNEITDKDLIIPLGKRKSKSKSKSKNKSKSKSPKSPKKITQKKK